jgi:hypothetical protein
MSILLLKEEHVLHRQIDQITAAEDLEDYPAHELGGKEQGDETKDKGADDAVGQRLFSQLWWQILDENRQDQGIVDGEDSLQKGQSADGEEVNGVQRGNLGGNPGEEFSIRSRL